MQFGRHTIITEILHHHHNRLRYGGGEINRYWSKASTTISHSLKNSQPSSDVKRVCVRHKPTLPPPAFWLPAVSNRLAIARGVSATGQQRIKPRAVCDDRSQITGSHGGGPHRQQPTALAAAVHCWHRVGVLNARVC